MGNTILLLDVVDPPAAGLGMQLRQCGFPVQTTTDLDIADRLAGGGSLALAVVRIADSGQVDVLRALPVLAAVPVVVVCTAHGADLVVRCLDAGADNVLVEPLSRRELAARIRAALSWRRESLPPGDWRETQPYHVGDVTIDIEGHLVMKDGIGVALTPTELRLLAALATRAGETVGHADLLNEVWGTACAEARGNLRLYIRYLRRKLENDRGEPPLLRNQRGVGYKLAVEAT